MIPSWAHDVKPEDITNATMLDLAELLGTENMLTLVESYSGMIIYVPKLDSLLRNIRDRRIRQEYDGSNTRALALKYDVSESWRCSTLKLRRKSACWMMRAGQQPSIAAMPSRR